MFMVGQKVCCVNSRLLVHVLTEGNVYTVSAAGLRAPGGYPFIRLAGVDSPVYFSVSRFRPVVERKTDISIFTKMLTPSDEEIGTDTLEPFPGNGAYSA